MPIPHNAVDRSLECDGHTHITVGHNLYITVEIDQLFYVSC